jgi:hypothetical protein
MNARSLGTVLGQDFAKGFARVDQLWGQALWSWKDERAEDVLLLRVVLAVLVQPVHEQSHDEALPLSVVEAWVRALDDGRGVAVWSELGIPQGAIFSFVAKLHAGSHQACDEATE